MNDNLREFDVILWGASGFTGRLVAAYLVEQFGVGEDLRWAIAGRNLSKLKRIRDGIPGAQDLPILTADSTDEQAMSEMAARSSVICTTVGPYALYGTPLLAACVLHGTHYCDLTGEVHWMSRMIGQFQEVAEKSGARIVHTCGFDCIPSDLGVWFLQEEMRKRHGVVATEAKFRVAKIKGGASGGTIYSIINMLDEADLDPEIGELLADPYALYPAGVAAGSDGNDQTAALFDVDFDSWTAPFLMAPVNTRVVRRSNALMKFSYGANFSYSESVLAGSGLSGRIRSGRDALLGGVGMGLMSVGPTRNLLRRMLPAPGEGPSQKKREEGYYDIYIHGSHPEDKDKDVRVRVCGDRDPGYGSTSKMLAEAAVCLAKDELEVGGGFWTPASALGGQLLERLEARAGLTFEVVDQVA
ncbi:MAG: short subunit dehydrogenase-like uncharacterized protein [Halieaceae bacterium]|jgi:short subunit dehydrogenase-like uncharacterized protein